jgi:hypothetical protein
VDDLRELRDALLDVHRELLSAQRENIEAVQGRMSNADLLQAAVTGDPRVEWLRPLLTLAADIDVALAEGQAPPRSLSARATELVAPPDPDTEFGQRYLHALQHQPGVVLAHARLAGLLRD